MIAEIQGRVRTADPQERVHQLYKVQANLRQFLSIVSNYEIVTPDDLELWSAQSRSTDPTRRRELKIKQYKAEKALKSAIDALRHRPAPADDSGGVYS